MSRGLYTQIGNRIRNSTFILPIFLACMGLMGVSLIRFFFDMYTNIWAVQNMDLQTFGMPVLDALNVLTVALMPQLLSYICIYIALAMEPKNKTEQWIRIGAAVTALVSLVIDIWFGYLFYDRPTSSSDHPLFMSVIADTVTSELGLTVAFGLILELKPDAWREFQRLTGDAERTRPAPKQASGQQTLFNQPKAK